jgi:hypothetical protein
MWLSRLKLRFHGAETLAVSRRLAAGTELTEGAVKLQFIWTATALILFAITNTTVARSSDDGYVSGTFAYTYKGKNDVEPKPYGNQQLACAALLREEDPPQTVKQADPHDEHGNVHCVGKKPDGSEGFDQYQNGVGYGLVCPQGTEEESPSDMRPSTSTLRCKCKEGRCPRTDAVTVASDSTGATAPSRSAAAGTAAGDPAPKKSEEGLLKDRCRKQTTKEPLFSTLVVAAPTKSSPSQIAHSTTPAAIADGSSGGRIASSKFEEHVAADVASSFGVATPQPGKKDPLPVQSGQIAWPTAPTVLQQPTLSLDPKSAKKAQLGEKVPDLLVLGPRPGAYVEIIEATFDAGFAVAKEPGGLSHKVEQVAATAIAASTLFPSENIVYTIRSTRMPNDRSTEAVNVAVRQAKMKQQKITFVWVCG